MKDVVKMTNVDKRFKIHEAISSNAEKERLKIFKKDVGSRKACILIAEDEGLPVGYTLAITREDKGHKVGKFGYLSDIYVRKKFRGKGYGVKLLEETEFWFKKKGIKYMSLDVNVLNSGAHKLYEKFGYFNYGYEMRKKI